MGIISFREVMKFNDADKLFEAAEWYYANSSISKTDNREESLNNAFILFDKISEMFPGRVDLLLQMLRIYTDYYMLDPNVKTANYVAGINNKVLNLTAPDDLFSAAIFYRNLLSSPDSTIYKLNIHNCLFGLADKINTLTENNDSLAKLEMTNLRSISYTLVQNRQFKTGLKGLQICYNADSSNVNNIAGITMAYMLNDQFENALKIINKWKDIPLTGYESVKVYSFGDGFLYMINDLESKGITHPDFAKARELLKK
jgi:hypothetical protein